MSKKGAAKPKWKPPINVVDSIVITPAKARRISILCSVATGMPRLFPKSKVQKSKVQKFKSPKAQKSKNPGVLDGPLHSSGDRFAQAPCSYGISPSCHIAQWHSQLTTVLTIKEERERRKICLLLHGSSSSTPCGQVYIWYLAKPVCVIRPLTCKHSVVRFDCEVDIWRLAARDTKVSVLRLT